MKHSVILLLALTLAACAHPKDGNNGADGKNGSSCTSQSVAPNSVAPNGGVMISCTDGTSNLVLNGTNGSNGHDGTNGHDGSNGTPGTVVASVQFCPGVTSYPATFSEVGFCIGNNLYAVYSANDGFMALIPPGVYSSNGINSSCTFTVSASCHISH